MMTRKSKALPEIAEQVYLSSSVTVAFYRELEAAEKRQEIAYFVAERFRERFLLPVLGGNNERCESTLSGYKNGFAMLAIACLMVETLEAFYQGRENTRNKSKQMFLDFFKRWEEFRDFRPIAENFYYDVRCGILHQAETRNGWVIERVGKLYDPAHKAINAAAFLKSLASCLDQYSTDLETADWDSILWVNFRKKMKTICDNCEKQWPR
jgi:hypothetical protein